MHLVMGCETSLICRLALLPLNVARSHWIHGFATGAMRALLEWGPSINELNAFVPELRVLPGVDEKEPVQRMTRY